MSNKKRNKENTGKEEEGYDIHTNGNGKEGAHQETDSEKDVAEKGNLEGGEQSEIAGEEAEEQQEEQGGTEKQEDYTEEEKLRQQLEEMKEKYLRLYSEFENFKKRTAREKDELKKNATENLIMELLPVLDDFDRAKTSMEEAENVDAVKEGVELVYDKLFKILQSKGLAPIEAKGNDFNTDEHEAVSQMPAQDESQKGKVMEEVQKGYYLNDKVIRFAKVVTGS